MNGQELYEEYARLNESICSCEVEDWSDLTENDQRVWDALAAAVGG